MLLNVELWKNIHPRNQLILSYTAANLIFVKILFHFGLVVKVKFRRFMLLFIHDCLVSHRNYDSKENVKRVQIGRTLDYSI